MRLLFLGTGSGKASSTRGFTSILLRDYQTILVDCGEGVSHSLIKHNIPFDEIGSIIISHLHFDHAAGLPGLLTQMKLAGRKSPLDIYVPAGLADILADMLRSFFIFSEGFPFKLRIAGFSFGEEVAINDSFIFKGMRNHHVSNKYKVEYFPEEKFVSASFLFKSGDKNIIYTSDVGNEGDLVTFDDRCDYLITETTHIPPEKLMQALVKYEPEKIILTHIDNEFKIDQWLQNHDKKIRKYFIVSHDGMEMSI